MKSLFTLGIVALALNASGQQADSTGLAGDNFSLQGALEMFRQSKDLDSFEKALNSADNHVNNLDLDSNGEVDYIQVRTQAEGESRIIVLQVAISKEESQDIAAIEMERTAEGTVTAQIRGDELLYPENTIVEPTEEVKEGGRKSGPAAPAAQITVWVNVWGWPSVQWCYGPLWWSWSSAWYWGYYPPWWRPWRPWGWRAWWGFPRPYWGWYHPVNVCRVEHAHSVYMHRRTVSSTVQHRTDVRPPVNRTKQEAKPTDRTLQHGGTDRTKQPSKQGTTEPSKQPPKQPQRQPTTRPTKKPAERTAPTKQPQRQSPSRSPSPSRQPTKAPGKR